MILFAGRAALVLDGLPGLRVLDLRRLLAGANLLGLLRFRRVRVGLHPFLRFWYKTSLK